VITVATLDEKGQGAGREGGDEPGLLLVFAGVAPQLRAIPFPREGPRGGGGSIAIGRDDTGGAPVADERMSRRHARIEWQGDRLVVEDLASRNGTFVDGVRVEGTIETPSARVIRAGSTLLVPVRNVRAFLGACVSEDGSIVAGPTLARALADIAAAAASGETMLLGGESGAGKENAARVFHGNGGSARGPFVAVNCATIPATVAERLLFGAKRGAYSGATDDADGFCAAADGGTLFLDEVGELPLDVQAKLLRFLETHEFFPLGASKPRRVSVRVCCATHRDLRDGVARGTFRGDLYYRLSTLEVRLPPLRERVEEIAWLIDLTVAASGRELDVHASFVEACILRPWPGNVRELLGAVRRALHAAREGKVLTAEHLEERAGVQVASSPSSSSPPPRAPSLHEEPTSESNIRVTRGSSPAPGRPDSADERERMIEALKRTGGNQTTAAAVLGMSRRTFIRRLEELNVPRPRATSRC
jgi:transcriptional regulator with GAF, ATPase, and Fis domain